MVGMADAGSGSGDGDVEIVVGTYSDPSIFKVLFNWYWEIERFNTILVDPCASCAAWCTDIDSGIDVDPVEQTSGFCSRAHAIDA
jgi:hypothetical protein